MPFSSDIDGDIVTDTKFMDQYGNVWSWLQLNIFNYSIAFPAVADAFLSYGVRRQKNRRGAKMKVVFVFVFDFRFSWQIYTDHTVLTVTTTSKTRAAKIMV